MRVSSEQTKESKRKKLFTQHRTYENAFHFFASDHEKRDRGEKTGVNYSTFGAPLPGRTSNANNYRYGQNSQEKDPEIAEGIYTAEYWQYDSRLGRRWNRDPKPMTAISVYACFANNPICFTDVQGDTIKFAPGTSAQFQQDYMEMVAYLRAHDAAQIIDELNALPQTILVQDLTVVNPHHRQASHFDPNTGTIYWNPYQLTWTDNDQMLSSTITFIHEGDHALQFYTNREQFDKDADTKVDGWSNLEEKRVITGSETTVARKLGEIGPFDVTRTSHTGSIFPSYGPTSTEINEESIPSSTPNVTQGDTTRTPAQPEQDPAPQPAPAPDPAPQPDEQPK